MYRRFKDRFGTAGVVLGVIAIVLAIGGSAIAASGLNGKQKKEVKAIAKSFQGTGPIGPAGAAGTAGPAGAKGDNGTNGNDGTNGADGKTVRSGTAAPEGSVTGNAGDFYIRTTTSQIFGPKTGANGTNTGWGSGTNLQGAPGADGISATTANEDPGGNCSAGGIKVSSASPDAYVCNGSPWVVGSAPSDAFMKGTWALPPFTAANPGDTVPIAISTVVPNSGLLAGVYVPIADQGDGDNAFGCTGSAENPISNIGGVLCLYEGASSNLSGPDIGPTGTKLGGAGGGAVILFKATIAGAVSGYGTWAFRTA
jgi:hypothetical protein